MDCSLENKKWFDGLQARIHNRLSFQGHTCWFHGRCCYYSVTAAAKRVAGNSTLHQQDGHRSCLGLNLCKQSRGIKEQIFSSRILFQDHNIMDLFNKYVAVIAVGMANSCNGCFFSHPSINSKAHSKFYQERLRIFTQVCIPNSKFHFLLSILC